VRIGIVLVPVCVVVVVVLVRAALIAVPQFMGPSKECRESALLSDLQAVRCGVELYTVQHLERHPHLDHNGKLDTANFIARLTGKTAPNGRLAPDGPYGPYLQKFPTNPFVAAKGEAVTFGTGPPPGDGSTGWYFNTKTAVFSPNDPEHKDL
jgi:hypothetical protein